MSKNRFKAARGVGLKTIITALKPGINLSVIDGTVLQKIGDTREYDFDIWSALRSPRQKNALQNMQRARAIRVEVVQSKQVDPLEIAKSPSPGAEPEPDEFGPPASPQSFESRPDDPSPASFTSEDSESSADEIDDEPIVVVGISDSEEVGAETEVLESAASAPSSVPEIRSSSSRDEQAELDDAEESAENASSSSSDYVQSDELGSEDGEDADSDEDELTAIFEYRYSRLINVRGVGPKAAEQLLTTEPNAEAIREVPRLGNLSDEAVKEVIEILTSEPPVE